MFEAWTKAASFEAWMAAVDAAVWAKADASAYDLPDVPYADWYADGMSPKAAATKAIKAAKGEDAW